MKDASMKYKGLETSYSLLYSYEVLMLQFRRKFEPRSSISTDQDSRALIEVPPMQYGNYNFTFSLLNLNAAIIEGVMRSILSEVVSEEMERQVELGIKSGRMERSHPENLLNKFYVEIEAQGGWERLKEQYASYLKLSIDKVVSPEAKEAMNVLFLLRNIFAHGTALIHPSEPIPDEFKEEAVFKWQSRLQAARIYLQKHFGHQDIFDNLAEYAVPAHFFGKSQLFLHEIVPAVGHKPFRAKRTIDAVGSFQYGYINIAV